MECEYRKRGDKGRGVGDEKTREEGKTKKKSQKSENERITNDERTQWKGRTKERMKGDDETTDGNMRRGNQEEI